MEQHGVQLGREERQSAAGRGEVGGEAALLWAAEARRPEVEEALRPLDGYRTVTGARIVHILTKVDKGLRPSQDRKSVV